MILRRNHCDFRWSWDAIVASSSDKLLSTIMLYYIPVSCISLIIYNSGKCTDAICISSDVAKVSERGRFIAPRIASVATARHELPSHSLHSVLDNSFTIELIIEDKFLSPELLPPRNPLLPPRNPLLPPRNRLAVVGLHLPRKDHACNTHAQCADVFNVLRCQLVSLQDYVKLLTDKAVAYLNVDYVLEGNSSMTVGAMPTLYDVIFNATKKVSLKK